MESTNESISTFDANLMEVEIVQCVIKNLNEIFGKDIQNLHKAKKTLRDLEIIQNELEQRLSFAKSEAPNKISKAMNNAEDALMKNKELENEMQDLNNKIARSRENKKLSLLLEEISPEIRIVQRADKVRVYNNWVTAVQELSSQIESCLNIGQTEQSLAHYQKLKESTELITASKCENLRTYTCKMLIHWHDILYNRLERDFQSILKTLKWPFIMNVPSSKLNPPPSDITQKLDTCIRHLLQLPVSSEVRDCLGMADVLTSSNSQESGERSLPSFISNFVVSSVPIQLLIKPLEVRFLFHFSGEKATNSQSNPEWYLTQVLKWITSHEVFIDNYIQPTLNKSNQQRINAKYEFIKGLLRLVVLKLSSDFPKIQDDEDLFCLTVQETLNFERELRLGIGYPASQPSVLSVLTQAPVFNAWISIERKFSLELMDEFVSNSNAWLSDEEGGMCQCGEQLVLLLQGITDRYRALSQPGHRLQFLDLQLELLDDFRVRILQMTKSELSDLLQSNYIAILNTAHHLISLISDWSDLPFFIEMQYFREKFSQAEKNMLRVESGLDQNFGIECSNSNDIHSNILSPTLTDLNASYDIPESVFRVILTLYSRIESNMLKELSQHVLTEIRAKSQPYRKDKWFASPSHSVDLSALPEVSPSLCSLLETLVKHLLLLRQNLAPRLFTKVWKELTESLDKFLYEEVVLQNTFSECGSAQLKHDMTKALFPIFGEFAAKPQNYFPLIKETCKLLTLSRPAAFLLRDSLQHSDRKVHTKIASPVKCLEELNVFQLTIQEALVLLNIRTNMATL